MASLSIAARRVVLPAMLAVLFAVLFASPAAAHAELLNTTPANGTQLRRWPTEVQLTFTESVNLIDGGIRLVDRVGTTVPTPDPTVHGHTVIWPMPADIPDGPYVVSWRVVSSDGHPIAGAFSFGVGTAATAVGSVSSVGSGAPTESTAPWQVVIIRLAGYVAFAMFAGIAVFLLFCAPDASKNPTLQLLTRIGLIGGAAAAVAAILVQGPYTAGSPMTRLLSARLIQETLATPFGIAMMVRLALYAGLLVLVWRLPRILTGYAEWLVPAGVVGIAITIAAAGHGAASGPLELGVDALHALTAGLWVGGLLALVVVGRTVQPRALQKFSTLAMVSVLTLITTGTLNALQHLSSIGQLLLTDYGLTLMLKLTLVAGTLVAAAVSRRRVKQNQVPLRSVRVEAAMTVAVLAVTALLSMTAPPPQAGTSISHAGHTDGPGTLNDSVRLSLGDRGEASLAVLPTETGSHLHLILRDTSGRPLPGARVTLKVANPSRNIAPIPIPMSLQDGVWVAIYRFPFPGTWKVIVTVDGIGPSAVVTAGTITI
jgi:copper transport protein